MACIPRAIDIFKREWEYQFISALEVSRDPLVFDGFIPHNANWHTWRVDQLNPAQCRVAAKHAQEDILLEQVKTGLVITSGLLLSAVTLAFVLLVASSVILFVGLFFAGLLELSAGILALEIGIWSAVVLVGAGLGSHGVAAIAWVITNFWTKEFLPAINRSAAYRDHLQTSIDNMMRKAENRA